METMDLINAIESGKTREIETAFHSLVQDRVDAALDTRHMELSQDMFSAKEEQ